MSVPVDSVELDRLFRRGFAATFALDLVTKALAAATVVALIRGLSVSSYAYTTLFLTFSQLSGAAAAGGVRTLYLREEAERVSRAGKAAAGAAFVDSLIKGILLIVVFGICAVPIADAFGYGSRFGSAQLILYATAFAIGYSVVELAIVHYQAGRHFVTAGSLNVLRALTLLGASLAITTTGQSVLVVSLAFIVSITAVGVIAAGPIARRSLLALRTFPRLSLFNREEMWLSFYSIGAAGFAYVDVMVAGALLGKHQVATLGASLRYLAIVLGAIPALAAILRVRTSQFDLIDSPANQRAMVLGWIRRATLPTALLIGSAVLLAPVVIPAIDKGRYPGSVEALQIFLVTAFSAYLTAPAANVLMAQRQYGTLTTIYAIGLLLNLAGDIIVAGPFGVVGIAIVSSTVYVAIDLAMVIRSLAFASSVSATSERSGVRDSIQVQKLPPATPSARGGRREGQLRILICSEQPPLPPPTGVRLVVRALVRELSRRHEVRVLCFGPTNEEGRVLDGAATRIVANTEPRRRNVAVRLVRAIVTGRPTRVSELERAMRGPLEEELKSFEPDVLHVTTGLLAGLGRQLARQPAVLVPLDAAYKMVEAQAMEFVGVRRRLLLAQAERMRRFEADEYARFRRVVVVTERDRDALWALDRALRVDVIPNGVDAEFFSPLSFDERQQTVVFHGAMNFAPNVRAAEYLATQVWPIVRRRRPDARLKIVGRAPVRKIRALETIDGVEVTGEVEDVRPWLRHGRVYACPMLTGTGIKNKLLEAMASGMACVVTPLALSGTQAVPGRDLLVADGAEALATQIVRLLDDDDLATRLGEAARWYVRTEHDWRAVAHAYERVYEAAIREVTHQATGARVAGEAI